MTSQPDPARSLPVSSGVEPAIGPAASLPAGWDSPTDRLICDLIAADPLTAPEIAARLAVPARTVRYRLSRLRAASAIIQAEDGRYRLAARGAGLADGPDRTLPAPAGAGGGGGAVVLVAVGALAAGCIGLFVWAARHPAPVQPAAPTAQPLVVPGWPYGIGLPGSGRW
jgi:hypothetical protein